MVDLFEGVVIGDDIGEIYEKLERNCPTPSTTSKHLWELRRACEVCNCNKSPEILLEKAVANLAYYGYMPGWYNQCPTASGIGDSSKGRRRNVDLVHWDQSSDRARLIELKVGSDDPRSALQQILQYGAVYAFCRTYKRRLPLHHDLHLGMMEAGHVSLEVIAPRRFYSGHDEADRVVRMQAYIDKFCRSRMDRVSMSVSALAFPGNLPTLENGREVKKLFGAGDLTDAGKRLREAFHDLTPVWAAP